MKIFLQKLTLFLAFCLVTAVFGVASYYLYKSQEPEVCLKSLLVNKDNTIAKAFFSPDDHPKDILIGLIKSEKKTDTNCYLYFN